MHVKSPKTTAPAYTEEAYGSLYPPPLILYALLFFVATAADLFDLFVAFMDALSLTGIGAIITIVVRIINYTIQFLISIFFIAVGWITNRKIRDNTRIQEKLEGRINTLRTLIVEHERNIALYTRRVARVARYARRMKALRPIVKTAIRKTRPIRRAIRSIVRNPLLKQVGAFVAELIPILDYLPWNTIGIALMYLDERAAYKDVRPVIDEYQKVGREEQRTRAMLVQIVRMEMGEEQREKDVPLKPTAETRKAALSSSRNLSP